MQEIDKIIRAWKDDDYRLSLSLQEQEALPPNPAGRVDSSSMAPDQSFGNYSFMIPSLRLLICICF